MSFKCTGARYIGEKHDICQDEIIYKENENHSIIAVSDGAGSKKFSHIGARKALFTLNRFFEKCDFPEGEFDMEEFAEFIKGELVSDINAAIHTAAWQQDMPKSEFACTVVFTVVYKDQYYITGHIGDGGIVSQIGDRMEILSGPENGEYKNTTYFITDADAQSHMRITVSKLEENRTAFLLCSDGISDLLFHKTEGADEISKVAQLMCGWLKSAKDEDEIEKVREAYESNLCNTFSKKSKDDLSLCVMCVNN